MSFHTAESDIFFLDMAYGVYGALLWRVGALHVM